MAAEWTGLQRIIKTAQRTAGSPLTKQKDLFSSHLNRQAVNIRKDSSPSTHTIFKTQAQGPESKNKQTVKQLVSESHRRTAEPHFHTHMHTHSYCPRTSEACSVVYINAAL